MTGDAGKQQTKVGEIRELVSTVHSLSVDVRDKASELTTIPPPDEDESKKAEVVAGDTISNELLSSLRTIRNILREAYATLKQFN